ncbi:FtsX-like permease family protein [Longispora sp. NPDC051575]|uniref:ABC transporter permease n=1 Tax=Longispora sp. NPDC051575 TaxID=3154943 RepID=UPI00341B5C3A
MFKLTLKSLRANSVRLILSSLAIVLGVAFIAGTFVFTDGLKQASYDKVGKLDQKTSVGVELSETAFRTSAGNPDAGKADPPGFDQATLDKVRGLSGVAVAEGVVRTTGGLTGTNGKPVRGYPIFTSVPTSKDLQSYTVTAGHLSEKSGELTIDHNTFAKQGFKLGDTVTAAGENGVGRKMTLVGVVDVSGTALDYGGAFLGVTPADALAMSGLTKYTGMIIAAKPGVADEALAKEVKQAVGPTGDVKTRQELLDAGLAQIVQNVEQFNIVLLTFGAISAFVAAFVIANTFTIVLAQRARQTALLRLVGATRGQAFRSVVLESAVVGFVASIAGILAGLGIAAGMQTVLRKLDFPMEGGLVLTWKTIVISLVIGTGITVFSALVPAWRGTRVPPVAALSDSAVETARKVGKIRLVLGAVALAAGVACLFGAGMLGSFLFVGAGGVLSFTGIVMFGPVLVPFLVRVLGWPLRKLFGATATLAISNAVRNPRRIAATSVALVIGIGLVSAFQVGGESVKAGIGSQIDRKIGADFMFRSGSGQISQELVDKLRKLPELGTVSEPRQAVDEASDLRIRSTQPLYALNDGEKAVDGDPSKLTEGKAVATVPTGLKVGDKVSVKGRSFQVTSVVKQGDVDKKPNTTKQISIMDSDFTALYPTYRPYGLEASTATGFSTAKAMDAAYTVLEDYPTVEVMDRAAYKAELTSTVDTMLAFVTAMLGLAVVISLIGVANTLTLSVVERTRENGVLRAVGLTRGKLRGMLAVEAILMALVGALLGVALGTAVSAGAMNMINSLGGDFAVTVPWGKLSIILGVAAAAALAASVFPARRAVGRPVVESLATE